MKYFLATTAWLALAVPTLGQDLRPYAEICQSFSSARAEARKGNIDGALEVLAQLLGTDLGCLDIPREAILFEKARLLESSGRLDEALAVLGQIEDGVLSDEVLFRKGRIVLRLGDVEAARAALGKIGVGSSRFVEARIALAEALAQEGRVALSVPALRGLLALDLDARGMAKVRLALARALLHFGDVEGAQLQAFKAFFYSDLYEEAEQVLKEAGRGITYKERALRVVLKGKEEEVRRLIRTLAKQDPQDGLLEVARGALLLQGYRDTQGALKILRLAREKAEDQDIQAFALWFLAQALVRADLDADAVDVFREIRSRFPYHAVAAHAGVAEAKALIRLRRLEEAKQVLQALEAVDPGFRREVLWLRALAALMGTDLEEKIRALNQVLAFTSVCDGVPFGLAEKALYFRGVVLWEAGNREQAERDIRAVARGFPHTYYGVLAVMRLREWGLAWQPSHVNESLERSRGPVMLWRLGEKEAAVSEMKARAHKGLLSEADLKVLAFMFALTGRLGEQSQRYIRGVPGVHDQWLFELAYPRPYKEIVEMAAMESGVEDAFVYGVMRAESGFNAKAKSPRGAVGLMQLMPRTARLVARVLFRDDRLARKIWDPKTNIRLGAKFLAELHKHFRGHAPLVLAGYNAGPAAARRFHKRLLDLPTDVFVEALPYAETQAYVKRVIGFTSGYLWFYGGGQVFEVPQRLPETLGPFMEPKRKGPLALSSSTLLL